MNLLIKNTQRLRLVFLMFLSCLLFGGIIARLYYLQVTRHDHFVSLANRQQYKRIRLLPQRAPILDRNDVILASSHESNTVVLNTTVAYTLPPPKKRRRDENGKAIVEQPKVIPVPPELIVDIAEVLKVPRDRVQRWFDEPFRRQVALNVSKDIVMRLQMLETKHNVAPNILVYERTSNREYPHGTLASHLIGYTTRDEYGSDNVGLGGVELQYNELLKGEYRRPKTRARSDIQRTSLDPLPEEELEATHGETLVLSIDQQIQSHTEAALRKQVGRQQARGGVAMVMDVKTGEILAMASCPDFDPNNFKTASDTQRRNAMLTDPIEPGSVMKIFTTAILLDNNLVNLEEMIDCAGGRTVIGGRKLSDSHKMGVEPFWKCFAESSNIAMAKLSYRIEPKLYYQSLLRCGFGARTGIDLPGEGSGILHHVDRWNPVMSRVSLAMGYEVSLTPMQVITALAAVGNKGVRLRPHVLREVRSPKGDLIRRNEPEVIDRLCSEQTAQRLLGLMERVVSEGTGDLAKVPGYLAGGKTGTTRKSHMVGEKRFIASFAGLVPIRDPRVAIYVFIDEPQGELFFGGKLAAPVFSEIAGHTMQILGVMPDNREEWLIAQQAQRALRADQLASATQTLSADADAAAEGDFVAEGEAAAAGLAAAVDTIAAGADQTLAAVAPNFETAVLQATADDPGAMRMPDFAGMTMNEAWETLAHNGLQSPRLFGTGVLTSQSPKPGVWVTPQSAVTLVFTPRSQVEEKISQVK
jgi:cell division protein FtsI/penicillin-binding protein 2